MTFADIQKANESISTMVIEKTDKKTGKVIAKDYAEVNQRIKAFRQCYPEGFIRTHMLSNDNGVCVFKAEVGYYDGGICSVILGTGTAYECETSSFINKTSYIENCETSAVGRALGMCGFGIDTSVASYEEVANAIENQQKPDPAATVEVDKEPVALYEVNPKVLHPTEAELKMREEIMSLAKEAGVRYESILKQTGLKDLDHMSGRIYAQLKVALMRRVEANKNGTESQA